MYNTKFP